MKDGNAGSRLVQTAEAPAPRGTYSQGRLAGGIVYVSGQGPRNPVSEELALDGFETQVRQTMENVSAVLEAAGASLSTVVKLNVYLADLSDRDALNDVLREYLSEPFPARTTVQVGLPGFSIEIDAIAEIVAS